MGGTYAVWEEPGKQSPRSRRAQQLARSSAQENARQKKEASLPNSGRNRLTGNSTTGQDTSGKLH
jgi:hypothetical protein